MDHDYLTEEQRIHQRLKETLTPREKMANWWDYHKLHVAFVVLSMLALLYFAVQERDLIDGDYTVGWVSGRKLDEATADALARRIAQYGEDLNGNGQVQVEIHQINLDLGMIIARGGGTEGQQEYGELMALEADLDVGQSGIFLTDDPAAFQTYTGAFLYRDGTMPEQGAADWEEMVVSWEQEGFGTIYAGLRGCWKADWEETWRVYHAMWDHLISDLNE